MTKTTLGVILGLLAVATAALLVLYWETLTKPDSGVAIRDVYLGAAGLGAIALTWWRGCIAEQQQKTAEDQEEINSTRLLVERFQKGVELLGGTTAEKIGGLRALTYLAISEDEKHTGSKPPPVFDMVLDSLRIFRTEHFQSGLAPEEQSNEWKVANQCINTLTS